MSDTTLPSRERGRFGYHRVANLLRVAPKLIRHSASAPDKRLFIRRLQNTYYANYINLYLAFGQTRSEREIRNLTFKALLDYLKNQIEYALPECWAGFEFVNRAALDDALALGKGAVVVSEHFGPQQYAFLELANHGYIVNAAISERARVRIDPWIERIERDLHGPQYALDGSRIASNFRLVTVEEASSALKMVRALRRGEIVMMDLDGNAGVGGETRTLEGAFTLSLLGREVHVRKGAAYLSYKTGAPIVPVIPLWEGERAYLRFYEPLMAQPGESLEDFCGRGLRQLHALLERHLIEHPMQWEMWHEFYKWVSPATKLGGDKQKMRSHFDAFNRALNDAPDTLLEANPRDTLLMKIKGQNVLIDQKGFRFFQISPATRDVLQLLYQRRSLRAVINRLKRKYRPEVILNELARLSALELISTRA